MGRGFKVTHDRGRWIELGPRQWALATVHPAFVLRARADGRGAEVHGSNRQRMAVEWAKLSEA